MFSVYICFAMAAFGGLTPLVLLYVKEGLNYGDGTTQLLSTVTIVGCASGYLLFPILLKKMGMRALQLISHGLFVLLIESLSDEEMNLRTVMKLLLKLEMGRFVVILPGERVRRNMR